MVRKKRYRNVFKHIEGKSVVAERFIRIKILNLKLLILLEFENLKNKKDILQ